MLTGLNWGHRRATEPMLAAAQVARERLGLDVRWEVQSLAGFEHGLDERVADRYDLVVFDHPFCGDVAAAGWMRPLDDLAEALHDGDFVGGSLASYRYAGHLWALPVDGATQVAVYRPDLIARDELPRAWSGVLELARHLRGDGRRIGLPTKSPHGVLALLALCANAGRPIALDPWSDPFDRTSLLEAAELLKEACALTDEDRQRTNAIDLHEAMVRDDRLAYCPLAYAYTTYAEADQRKPLRFAGFPGPSGTSKGSVLGGTGLGITRGCRDVASASAFVTMLSGREAQCEVLMHHHGQPGRVEGWRGAVQDRSFAGTHAGLHDALRDAWTRPRFPGYIRWQAEAGHIVEDYLSGLVAPASLPDALAAAWRRHAPPLPRSRPVHASKSAATAPAEGRSGAP